MSKYCLAERASAVMEELVMVAAEEVVVDQLDQAALVKGHQNSDADSMQNRPDSKVDQSYYSISESNVYLVFGLCPNCRTRTNVLTIPCYMPAQVYGQ